MRQVGIKQLKANLSKELQDLPFEVTTKGAIVAQVTTPSDHLPNQVTTSEQDRPVRDLSKEAQARGRMGASSLL